jgi:hypothetical protein
MSHGFRTKPVLLQCTLAFRDNEIAGAGKDPFVAFLEADAAVAFADAGEFGELGSEFEGTAVAVTIVGFELWSGRGGWLRHCVSRNRCRRCWSVVDGLYSIGIE